MAIFSAERRGRSKARDDFRENVKDPVHFFLRIISAETESGGAVDRGEWNFHGPQDVRRFQRTACAGGTA